MLKRGEGIKYSTEFFAGLIVLFVLLVVGGGIILGIVDVGNVATCKVTVFAATIQKELTRSLLPEGQLLSLMKCKTIRVEISNDNYQINDRRPKQLKGFQEDAINKIIADQMQQCWNTFGEGTLDPFGNWEEGDSRCYPCAEIEFSDVSREEIAGFYQYLNENTARNQDITYAHYLNNGEDFTSDDELDFKYSTKYDYAVLFTAVDKNKYGIWAERALKVFGCDFPGGFLCPPTMNLGSITSIIEGLTEEHVLGVLVTPVNNVNNMCDDILI